MHSAKAVHTLAAYRNSLAAAALAGVAFVAYVGALDCQFVNLDDPDYVTRNPHVSGGLTPETARWAFTAVRQGNWHPLTWMSLQLDATLWGMDPRGFHLTNVLLHAANAALLFLALQALTGAYWRSAATALLFTVHPLRVESVAWITERKDLLYAAFGFVTLWAYAIYAVRPSAGRYLGVLAAFVLSLLSKPMLVTLPFLLLVLDWWPLRRAQGPGAWPTLVREKLPLFALVLASSVVTFSAQSAQGAMGGAELFPRDSRIGNAAIAYVMYLSKTVWPANLAVFYPHPLVVEAWKVGGSVLAIGILTGLAVALRRRAPYLLAGWLWYLGTLVPVLGLVQVGGQAYADRYTYFPQIGIVLATCWAVADLARSRPRVAAVAVGALALVLAVVTRGQIQVWRNSVTLWQHALNATGPNAVAVDFLGMAWHQQGRDDEAAKWFEQTCLLAPSSSHGYVKLGKVRLKQGKQDEAERLFEKAVLLQPPQADAFCNLGLIALNKGNPAYAARRFREALRLVQTFADAHSGLGMALVQQGNVAEGMAELQAAIDCDSRSGQAHLNLARVLESRGDLEGAASQYREVARLNPEASVGWYNLGRMRVLQRRFPEAVECFERAREREPASALFRSELEKARRARDANGISGRAG